VGTVFCVDPNQRSFAVLKWGRQAMGPRVYVWGSWGVKQRTLGCMGELGGQAMGPRFYVWGGGVVKQWYRGFMYAGVLFCQTMGTRSYGGVVSSSNGTKVLCVGSSNGTKVLCMGGWYRQGLGTRLHGGVVSSRHAHEVVWGVMLLLGIGLLVDLVVLLVRFQVELRRRPCISVALRRRGQGTFWGVGRLWDRRIRLIWRLGYGFANAVVLGIREVDACLMRAWI